MQLGKCWARALDQNFNYLENNRKIGASSCIDIAGVASSILATPTIFPS